VWKKSRSVSAMISSRLRRYAYQNVDGQLLDPRQLFGLDAMSVSDLHISPRLVDHHRADGRMNRFPLEPTASCTADMLAA
jgi:hypothetical protein